MSLSKNKEFIIPYKRFPPLLLFGVPLLVFGCVLVINEKPLNYFHQAMGYLGLVLFSLSGLYILFKSFQNQPAIIINSKGLFINVSLNSPGWLGWDEIQSISFYYVNRQQQMGIYLKDSEKTLRRLSPLRRFWIGLCIVTGYPPISIPAITVPVPLEKILEEIKNSGYYKESEVLIPPPETKEEKPSQTSSVSSTVSGKPYLTFFLLAVLIIVFIIEEWASSSRINLTSSINFQVCLTLGALNRNLILADGEWYRAFTSILLHANFAHLLGNGIGLYIAGLALENFAGRAWFFTIFLLSGLSGSLFSMYLNPANTVSMGASGAIMGLMAATFVIAFKLPSGPFRSGIQMQMFQILLASLIPQAVQHGEHIDYSSHLGGAICGALLGLFLFQEWQGTSLLPRFTGLAKFVLTLGVVAFILAVSVPTRNYLHLSQVGGAAIRGSQTLELEKDPAAMNKKGVMYHKGRGVPTDYVKAVKWYRKAAILGYPAAERNLGYMYMCGF
ncbi:MAG TPA: rhomboid family intramembrane serine protease, partial [bacterium]